MNAKQEKFAMEYAREPNATQAAINAGYSERSAHSHGYRLLKDDEIRARIAELTTEFSGPHEIDAERVIKELSHIGTGELRDVAEWDESGLRIIPSAELTKSGSATIKSVKSTTVYNRREDTETVTLEVTQHDKVRALDLLGRRFALFTDKVQQSSDGDFTVRMLGLPDKSRGSKDGVFTGGAAQGELRHSVDDHR